MFRQAVQSVVFWGHRTWQAVSEIRLLVLPDPLFLQCVRACVCACVCVCFSARVHTRTVPLCSEGCKCNLRHMLLRLMFFRLMSVTISISPAKTQECSLEYGLIHTYSNTHTHTYAHMYANHWVNTAQLPFWMIAQWLFDAVIYFERSL